MEQLPSTSRDSPRLLSDTNATLSVNEYLESSASPSTKKLINQVKNLFKQTMESLNQKEGSNFHTNLDDYEVEDLPNVLARFFMVCVQANGAKFNASTLSTYYSVMIRYLKFRDTKSVDISSDLRFTKVGEVVKARQLESAKSGQRAGIHASQSLTASELKQVMASGAMSRENPRSLISLVHYHLMTGFGCRAREECRAITNGDLIHGPESDVSGLPQFISLSERITKTRRGNKNDKRDLEGRVYIDNQFPELCPVRNILFYQSKKTSKQASPDYTFLLTVKQSALREPEKQHFWYSDHPMGVNYIGSLFKKAIELSGVDIGDKKISGTSARKNLVQTGAEGSVPSPLLSKLLGQKQIDSKLEYLKNTDDTHRAASLVISRGVQGVKAQDFSEVFKEIREETSPEISADPTAVAAVENSSSVSDPVVPHVQQAYHQSENHGPAAPVQGSYFHHPPSTYHAPMPMHYPHYGPYYPPPPPPPYHGHPFYPPPPPYYGAPYHPYPHPQGFPGHYHSEPTYNQNSWQSHNCYNYPQASPPPSFEQQPASNSVKRPLSDVTNNFVFKKPKSDEKTYTDL